MSKVIDFCYQSFLQTENELTKRRKQAEGVKGKDTPYRVEFRYPEGTKHWQYFQTISDARKAEDSLCTYNIYGKGVVKKPISQQTQVRGIRGGWSKLK